MSEANVKEKNKYLIKNTALFGVSSFASKLLTFLLVPLYTSVLSRNEYGIADIIITTDNLLIYIFTLNIAEAVVRFAIEKNSDKSGIFFYGIKVIILGSILVLFGIIISSFIIRDSWPFYCYIFMFLYYIATAISNVLTAFTRAIDRLKEGAIAGVISTSTLIFLNLFLLLFIKIGPVGYYISLVTSSVITSVYLGICIKKSTVIKVISLCNIETRHNMLKYSIPLIFNGICWWINNSLDKYFINSFLDVSYVGLYSVAYKIPLILFTIQSIFSQAWNLSVIKEFNNDDSDGFISNTYKFYNGLLVISTSTLIILCIPIARILFAKEFFYAWPYAVILIVATMFSALGAFIGGIFVAVKDSKSFSFTTVIAAVGNIILNTILIPKFQLYGAAIATLFSFFIMWVLRMLIASKVVHIKINWVKNIISYVLILSQIALELTSSHYYLFQIIIWLIILIINFDTIISIIKLISECLNKINKNRVNK